MIAKLKYRKLILPLVSLAFMVSGCNQEDLAAVERFGSTSVSIQESSNKMIQDIYDSCTRKEYVQIQYANARILAAPRDLPESVTANPTNSLLGTIPNTVSPSTTIKPLSSPYEFPPAKIRFKCESKKNQAQLLQNMNDVLTIYVATLGRLASHNTVSFDQNLKAIGESIISLKKETSLLDAQTQIVFNNGVNNGITISTSLLNLIADQQRQEKLKPIIVCSNDTVVKYVENLQQMIKLFYVTGVLQDEEETNLQYIEEMYSIYLANASTTKPETNSEAYMTLENDYKQRIEGIEARKASAQAYTNILEKTSLTHQALAKTFRGDINQADQKILCQNEGYLPSATVIPTQQSTLDLTPQQIQEAYQILSEYEVSIQPSLKVLKQTYR